MRQLRDVWEIQHEGSEGSGLIQILEARLASQGEVPLELRPEHIRATRAAAEPSADQWERVLGDTDAKSIRWYRTGLDRAASVASVRLIQGKRFGTAVAVRAGDLGLEPASATLALTNYHVVNQMGLSKAEKPADVEIAFEAAGEREGDIKGPYPIRKIVAESPAEGGLDYSLLELDGPLEGIPTIPLAEGLPDSSTPERKRVYLISHPRGDDLHIALQDNHLIAHEGPPDGTPPDPTRIRVHYHAPSAKGSSGAPVFDWAWRAIALHHAGGEYDPRRSLFGMPRLNGKEGRCSANEGYWIGSIVEDARVRTAAPPPR